MIEQRYRKCVIAITCEHMADPLRLNNFELRRQFAEESDTLIRHDVAIFRSDHDDWSCNAGRCRLYRLAFGGWVEEFGGDGAWVPMPVEAPVVTAAHSLGQARGIVKPGLIEMNSECFRRRSEEHTSELQSLMRI